MSVDKQTLTQILDVSHEMKNEDLLIGTENRYTPYRRGQTEVTITQQVTDTSKQQLQLSVQ